MRTQKAICLEPVHFGDMLREARLRSGRTLADVSRRTKIPANMLERLERGDTEAMPADVFVCGFLRAFAREVGVDGNDAVARYRRVTQTPRADKAGRELDIPALRDESLDESAASDPASVAPTELVDATRDPSGGTLHRVDSWLVQLGARFPVVESVLGRGPTVALVVLLVVLVATITLSLLLGGDPQPGRGLS